MRTSGLTSLFHVAMLGTCFFGLTHPFTVQDRVLPLRTHHRDVTRSTRGAVLATTAAPRDNSDGTMIPPGQHVVVVGGGVGGLAIASRIAHSCPSCRVTVLEKNEQMGGRCGSFQVQAHCRDNELGTFRHERGPSLLLLPHVYNELFRECGSTPEDFGLEIRPCIPAYQVIFADGDRIQVGFRRHSDEQVLSAEEQQSRKQMDSFEANGALKWDRYMQICEAYLDCGLPNFIEQRLDLASFPAFLSESLRNFGQAWPLKPHSDVLDALFESDKMRSLASFQDLYVGLEPFRNDKLPAGGIFDTTAPSVFGLLAAIELHSTNPICGVYAPIGGFQKVTDSMDRLARSLGVTLQCRTTVTKVTDRGVYYRSFDQGSTTSTLEFMPADLVVVNADLPYAKASLLQKNSEPGLSVYDWTTQDPGRPPYRFSSGVLAFHWSLGVELSDLNTHNVFLSGTSRRAAQKSWSVLRDNDRPGTLDDFNFYVHRATKTDSTCAPKGCDAILVLVPCETLTREPAYAGLARDKAVAKFQEQFDSIRIDQVRQAVIRRLAVVASLKDFQFHILDEVVETPGTYADRYNVAAGTPFALSHGLAQLSLARPGAKADEFDNVIFVGASSRPGNGVPLVLIGAKQAADMASRKLAGV